MRSVNLLEEIETAASRMRRYHFERFRTIGIPWSALASLGADSAVDYVRLDKLLSEARERKA